MQYLVRQDTSVSMDTFKSESHSQIFKPTDPCSETNIRIRRHFSSASSLHTPNMRRPSSGSFELFVSLPTCNANSASNLAQNTPLSPGPVVMRRQSSASSLSKSKPVTLLSVSPLVNKIQHRYSFMSKSKPDIYELSKSGKSASFDETDNNPPKSVKSPVKLAKSSSMLNKSNFLSGMSSRRSIRQGINYLLNPSANQRKNSKPYLGQNDLRKESLEE